MLTLSATLTEGYPYADVAQMGMAVVVVHDGDTDAADREAADLAARVDVVVLNSAPSDLVHRVLRDGILVLERDRAARVRFEVRSRNDYFDMLPIRNACRHPRARSL